MKRRYTLSKLSDVEFVALWNACHSQREVAERTGMRADTAAHRAIRLRRQGYIVKSLRKDNDYTKLNKLVADMVAGKAKLTSRDVIILYMAGVRFKKIMQLTGKSWDAVRSLISLYRRHGAIIPHRNKGKGREEVKPEGDIYYI